MVKLREPFDAAAFVASQPSFSETNSRLLQQLTTLVPRWLPDGKLEGCEYVARNPRRQDQRLGSFRINLDTGKWADFASGERGGDPISLYAFVHSINQHTALRELATSEALARSRGLLPANPANSANTRSLSGPSDSERAACKLYNRAKPLLRTPAETYLRRRSLTPGPAWSCLRFDALRYRGVGLHPTLIAPVFDHTGQLAGIQRTYLASDGLKLAVDEPKLSLGRIRGGAIRLAEPHDELFVCEGLEDGLTLAETVPGACVWVAAGGGMMPSMLLPPHVSRVIIAADNDAAGEQAADAAASHFAVSGKSVRIIRPPERAKDFNQALMECIL